MTLKQYEDLQVKLDNYADYMIGEIEKEYKQRLKHLDRMDISELEETMEELELYNKYKESD